VLRLGDLLELLILKETIVAVSDGLRSSRSMLLMIAAWRCRH